MGNDTGDEGRVTLDDVVLGFPPFQAVLQRHRCQSRIALTKSRRGHRWEAPINGPSRATPVAILLDRCSTLPLLLLDTIRLPT